MLEFRLKPPFACPPLRTPRINRAHPLFNQQHIVHLSVARGAALVDLLTGAVGTNTTTLGGVDSNGPYIWSNDNAGTATISMPTSAGGAANNFNTFGAIFQLRGTNRQIVWGISNPLCGFFNINASLNFNVAGGTVATFNCQPGHTYFGVQTNAVATASQQRISALLDLTTGQVFWAQTASANNLVMTPAQALVVETGTICTNRLYAAFACSTALVPPAVNPAATFYSIDQIMAGFRDPWGLWYG
jgi:hypothetical protein